MLAFNARKSDICSVIGKFNAKSRIVSKSADSYKLLQKDNMLGTHCGCVNKELIIHINEQSHNVLAIGTISKTSVTWEDIVLGELINGYSYNPNTYEILLVVGTLNRRCKETTKWSNQRSKDCHRDGVQNYWPHCYNTAADLNKSDDIATEAGDEGSNGSRQSIISGDEHGIGHT